MRLSRTPNVATPAPARTNGPSHDAPLASTTSRSGASLAARSATGTTARTVTATSAYSASTAPRASGIARGIVRAGSRTSSPSVAMRA